MNDQCQILLRRYSVFEPDQVKSLAAVQSKRGRVCSFLKLTRQNTHAYKIAAMNAFEALCDDSLHAQQPRAFGGPLARTPGSVFLTRNDNQRNTLLLIFDCGVVDADALA